MSCNEYFYEVDINLQELFKKRSNCHYTKELLNVFGDIPHINADVTFTFTKEQFGKFLYLRCRMGGDNGMRNLNMNRVHQTRGDRYDLTKTEGNKMCDKEAKPSIVALAKELEETERYLATAEDGRTPLTLGNLKLNTKHMILVLRSKRESLRKQIARSLMGEKK